MSDKFIRAKNYQKKREDKEWVEDQRLKSLEYKKKNKTELAIKTAIYKKTFKGKMSHKISEWKSKHKLKETPERLWLIFARWWYSQRCELCNLPYKNDRDKCMEHHHQSGHFRCICCQNCNQKLAQTDRKKQYVLLELHRYSILHHK
jgi:hypothetical protein